MTFCFSSIAIRLNLVFLFCKSLKQAKMSFFLFFFFYKIGEQEGKTGGGRVLVPVGWGGGGEWG
jgi:hypothetical protein